MIADRIPIDARSVQILVERTDAGGLSITHPRKLRIVSAVCVLLLGFLIWTAQLPADPWGEPLQYVLGLLLLAPGIAIAQRAIEPRPVAEAVNGELIVRYGRPFFEREVARLPLAGLEVRLDSREIEGVRYDEQALRRRLLAAFGLSRGRLSAGRIPVKVVQARIGDDDWWVSVIGSPLVSEAESARLALTAAAAENVPVELDRADEDNFASDDDGR